jgi:hypothetical protein
VTSGLETRLLARARDLEDDAEELAETVAGIHVRARATGLDRAALTGLGAAARALADSAAMPPPPGPGRPARYRTDVAFIDAVTEAEDDAAAALRSITRFRAEAHAALTAARAALIRAFAMPVTTPEQRAARRDAIAATRYRIGLCQDALDMLGAMQDRFGEALRQLRRVPGDLGWLYQAIYDLRRQGRELPEDAREWFDAAGGAV